MTDAASRHDAALPLPPEMLQRLRRPSLRLVFKHRRVLLRALRLAVRRHGTYRCACDFCTAYRELVSHEPHPRYDGGEYVGDA